MRSGTHRAHPSAYSTLTLHCMRHLSVLPIQGTHYIQHKRQRSIGYVREELPLYGDSDAILRLYLQKRRSAVLLAPITVTTKVVVMENLSHCCV